MSYVGHVTHDAAPHPTDRLGRAQKAAADAGLDALLISPGADLRYLTGYEALPLERLTCLVVPVGAEPFLVVPGLEKPAALASPAGELGIDVAGWGETEDPYALIAGRLPRGVARVGLDNHMWAEKVLAFRAALPTAEQSLAGDVLRELRMRKSAAEVAALRRAARRSTGCTRAWATGSGRAAPSARSARTSPTRSSPRATCEWTS